MSWSLPRPLLLLLLLLAPPTVLGPLLLRRRPPPPTLLQGGSMKPRRGASSRIMQLVCCGPTAAAAAEDVTAQLLPASAGCSAGRACIVSLCLFCSIRAVEREWAWLQSSDHCKQAQVAGLLALSRCRIGNCQTG